MSINVKKLIQSVSKKNKLTKIYSGNVNFNSLHSKNTASSRPAPHYMQRQWKAMSPVQKTVARYKYNDHDKDGVPDKWDCQPRNKYKQDSPVVAAEDPIASDQSQDLKNVQVSEPQQISQEEIKEKPGFWKRTGEKVNKGFEAAHRGLVGTQKSLIGEQRQYKDKQGNVRIYREGGISGQVGQLSNLSSVAREDSVSKVHSTLGYGGQGFSSQNPFFGSQARGSDISHFTGTGTGMGIYDTLGLERPRSQSQGSSRQKYAYDTRGRRYVVGGENAEAVPYQKQSAKKSTGGKKKVFVKGYYTYR